MNKKQKTITYIFVIAIGFYFLGRILVSFILNK